MRLQAFRLLVAVLAAFGEAKPVFAATLTWDANTGSAGAQDGAGTWNASAANWWNGTSDVVWPNTTSDTAIFGAGSDAAGTITVGTTITLNAITFNAPGSGNYTLSGGTLSLGGTTPTITANNDSTINSVLDGSAGLVKDGSFTLVLSAANTYTGDTTVNAGVLHLSRTGSAAAGTIKGNLIVNNATVNVTAENGLFGYNPPTQTVTLNAGGILNLNVANKSSHLGAIALNGGTLSNTSTPDPTWGTWWLDGNITANNATISTMSATNMVLNGGRTFTVTDAGGTLNVTGNFGWSGGGSNAGSLTKAGPGTMTLTRRSSYTGGTTVSGGTLTINAANAANSAIGTGTLTIGSGAQVNAYQNAFGWNYQTPIEINGGTLNQVSLDSHLNSVTMTAGVLSGTTFYLHNPVTINASANTSTISASSLSLASGITFTVADGAAATDLFVSSVISGNNSLTKEGAGLMQLSAANTYTGDTTVNAGVLHLSRTGSATAGTIKGNLIVNNATVNVTAENGLFGYNPPTQTVTLNAGGILNLNVANKSSHLGAIALNGGTLSNTSTPDPAYGTWFLDGNITANNATISTMSAANMVLNGGRTFTVADAGGTLNVTGNFGWSGGGYNAGSLTKAGPGAMILAGNNYYTGGTLVHGGTLRVSAPDAAGTYGMLGTGPVTVNPNATLTLFTGSTANNHTYNNNISLNSATLRFEDGTTILPGTIALTGNNTFHGVWDDKNMQANGVVSGTGGILKTGDASLLMNNANTYSGVTTISGGEILIGVNPVGIVGAITSSATGVGTVQLNGGALSSNGATARDILNPVEVTQNSTLGNATNNGSLTLRAPVLLGGAINTPRTLTVESPVEIQGNVTSGSLIGLTKAGGSTLTLSGSGDWNGDTYMNAGTLHVAGGGINNSGNIAVASGATLRINTSGQVRGPALNITGGGTVLLEAGTLRTNSITGSANLVWTGGDLAIYSNVGLGNGSDVSSPNGSTVYRGRKLTVTGDLTTGAGTSIDLGQLYIAGSTVFNHIAISGSLTVGANTTLRSLTNPYLLRGSNGGAEFDYGSLVLVEALGGIINPGNIDFVAPGPDARSFSEYTGLWVVAGDPNQLPVDTWYLETTATQIIFHYKVSAAVPEPASAGIMIAGGLLLRVLSRRRRAPHT